MKAYGEKAIYDSYRCQGNAGCIAIICIQADTEVKCRARGGRISDNKRTYQQKVSYEANLRLR